MNEYVRNLNRIEFVVTMACTGKCKHCSEGDHRNCSEYINPEIAVKAIRDVCSNYRITSLMTFGGEPLLHPDVVCAIHKTASEIGIENRELITNGFFAKDRVKIKDVVHNLKEAGVKTILLSVDAFHQETIPLDPVKYFAECAVEEGLDIQLSPAWLVSMEDNNPYNVRTRELLAQFEYLNMPVGEGNVIFPSGNALKYLKEYFEENIGTSNPYDDDPRDIRSIGFSPNGDVLNDNVYKKDILKILDDYRP